MNASSLVIHAGVSRDPTHTTALRAKYAAKMRGRWGKVRKLAADSLKAREHSSRAAFGRWFERTIQAQVLENEGTWQREYLKAGHGRGVKQADLDVQKFQLPKEGLARRMLLAGVYAAALEAAVQKYSKDLQAISEEVVSQVEEAGFEAWDVAAPADFIVRMDDRIQKVGVSRSTILAVTSVVDVFNQGILDRFEGLGFRSVGIIPETIFTTAGDERVCAKCRGLSGRTWNIFEARGILPVHPRCRCRWRLDVGSLAGLVLLAR